MTYSVCLAEVGPKKILDLMNVPWLTRENVASHLQVDPLALKVLELTMAKSHYQVGFLQHIAFPYGTIVSKEHCNY